MTLQMKRKEVMRWYDHVISIPYGAFDNLLSYVPELGFTSGKHGWNADVYAIADTAIVTGARPFGNIHPSRELIGEYESRASIIVRGEDSLADQDKLLWNLINRFIKEVTNQ